MHALPNLYIGLRTQVPQNDSQRGAHTTDPEHVPSVPPEVTASPQATQQGSKSLYVNRE